MNPDKLSSLDEAVGTIVTIITLVEGALALFVEALRPQLVVIVSITLAFYWVGYRVAKILHAVEIRVWIVDSLTYFPSFTLSIPFFMLCGLLRGNNEILSFLFLMIGVLLNTNSLKVDSRFSLWKWLCTSDPGDDKVDAVLFDLKLALCEMSGSTTVLFRYGYALVPAYVIALVLFAPVSNLAFFVSAALAPVPLTLALEQAVHLYRPRLRLLIATKNRAPQASMSNREKKRIFFPAGIFFLILAVTIAVDFLGRNGYLNVPVLAGVLFWAALELYMPLLLYKIEPP